MKEQLKKKYFKAKEEIDIIRNNETLAKWKVLSKAYKLGKQIWGTKFTRQRLAYDMDLPLTTTYRCLSLDRANKKSWALVNSGKLSVFKLAMICSLKSIVYQDEIVKMAVEDNLSTYQIKNIRVDKLTDINKERHRLAIEKGYSRKSSAAWQFQHWIERGNLFLLIRESALTKEKQKEIKQQLKELNKRIDSYVNGN